MIRPLAWCLIAAALTPVGVAQPLGPGEEPDVVASARLVENTSYHVPAFDNYLVTVLNVYIPPHRESGYHLHSIDSIGILISDTERTSQVLGAEPTVTAPRGRGSVSFTGYASNHLIHNVAVTGDSPFHNIVLELNEPARGFRVGARGQGYTQIFDNERVRAWRLVLEPGETAPVITQSAPGMRVVIEGGELVELVPDSYERAMAPRSGEFFWQDAGGTRAVRNVGTTRIELIELELK